MEHGLDIYYVLCSKTTWAISYDLQLAQDKPLGAPAFVSLIYLSFSNWYKYMYIYIYFLSSLYITINISSAFLSDLKGLLLTQEH